MTETLLVGQILQNAASALGNGTAVNLKGLSREAAVYVIWSSGVTAGQVVVETADDEAYTGTWAPFAGAVLNAAADKQDVVQMGGVIRAVRARIATAIVGGTVTAKLYAN